MSSTMANYELADAESLLSNDADVNSQEFLRHMELSKPSKRRRNLWIVGAIVTLITIVLLVLRLRHSKHSPGKRDSIVHPLANRY
jgi:sensor c-di-GMP phosphodiesterase-like protein